jgi:hypothetical protein
MGYSIDSGAAIIEPTSFSAIVSATPGPHVLHVKCWGHQTNAQTLLNITVGQSAATSGIVVSIPASAAKVSSPFTVVASASNCGWVPAVSMGYSIDSGSVVIKPTSFTASVTASAGSHTLHVKCWGHGTAEQVLLPITVGPSSSPTAATPQFSLASGQYTSKQTVSLFEATSGAAIYYTTNGTPPTASSLQYAGPILVGASEEIEAIAVAQGYTNSGLARADYVIKLGSSGPTVPSNAIASTDIQTLSTWHWNHDPGTTGTASGTTELVGSPSLSGNARKFSSSYTDAGGEIYSVDYATDTTSMNLVYDGWVWFAPGSQISNLEMDSNQVLSNGNTVIYAFQCSGYTKTWEYSGAGAHWVSSTQPCDVSSWTTDTWHHIQISYSRDDSGYVTYHSVWVDGAEQVIEEAVPSSFALGWKIGVLQTQFQIDGIGASGANVVYLDELTIYRW